MDILELKNIKFEIQNLLDKINSRLDRVENRICDYTIGQQKIFLV